MFWSTAHAQAQAAAAQPSGFEMFLPFIFIFGVFYFLIIRPQAKRQKQHQSFLTGLKRGDAVLTTGGMLGTIEGITETHVTLEIADGVKIKMVRSSIAGPQVQQKKEG